MLVKLNTLCIDTLLKACTKSSIFVRNTTEEFINKGVASVSGHLVLAYFYGSPVWTIQLTDNLFRVTRATPTRKKKVDEATLI